jgi:hypothetical protein
MVFEPDGPTSRRRREVGVFARAAWSAVQQMLQRFRTVKEQRDDEALLQTRRACDEALAALDRLRRAVLSLRGEMDDHRVSITHVDLDAAPRESLH